MQTQRTILGIIAALFTIGGALLYYEVIEGSRQAGGMFFKAGLGLSAIWLALPQLEALFSKSNSAWFIYFALGVGCIAIPGARMIAIPALIAFGITQFIKYLFKPLTGKSAKKSEAPNPNSETNSKSE